jgi:beta-galactosidase GanA
MPRLARGPGRRLPEAVLSACALGALFPLLAEMRVVRARRSLTDRWQRVAVEARGTTLLGISFRTPQVEALGLDAQASLRALLAYPFQLIRLGAYWQRIEPEPGVFDTRALDWQIDAAEQAGKQIIVCLGPVKTFGYPETFVPAHQLRVPLREGALATPATHGALLKAATAQLRRLVERYRNRGSIIAWQVEQEAVDPLGVEHSWRLSRGFVGEEVALVRAADPSRPILLNGFLPTSLLVRLPQWWRTRDQGDSLALAQRLADIVGIDFYPRHALLSVGDWALYLDGSRRPWQQRRRRQLFAWAAASGRRLMISEGQAEPWETVTTPPSPDAAAMASCPPEQLIANYNQCMRWQRGTPCALDAYLFWGAEYWLLRRCQGDSSYLDAFARVLEHS